MQSRGYAVCRAIRAGSGIVTEIHTQDKEKESVLDGLVFLNCDIKFSVAPRLPPQHVCLHSAAQATGPGPSGPSGPAPPRPWEPAKHSAPQCPHLEMGSRRLREPRDEPQAHLPDTLRVVPGTSSPRPRAKQPF